MNDVMRVLRPGQLARRWGLDDSQVRRIARQRGLRARRTPGGHRRFSLSDIEAFEREHGIVPRGTESGIPGNSGV